MESTKPDLRMRPLARVNLNERWLEWTALALIVVVGIVMRFYKIDTLPPDLHYDQAHNALLSWETYIGQSRPIFYTAFTGMEPMIFYSIAFAMWFMGHTSRAIHVTSAVYGSLTVVLTYFMARDMFGGAVSRAARWIGLFAAGFMATSTWHLVNSRNGFRVITLPFCELLTIWALWVAMRTGRPLWWVAAGAALSATAYTYYSSRLVPIALGAFLLLLAVREWRLVRERLAGLAVMLIVAAVVLGPLAWFYYQNPEYLFVRADQAWIFSPELSGGNPWRALGENTVEVAQMFWRKGDHNWRFNVAPRPIFDPLMAALTLGGLLLFVGRAVGDLTPRPPSLGGKGEGEGEPEGDHPEGERLIPTWAAYAVSLLFIVVMLVPSFLSVEGRPNSVRGLGALPFLYFLPAVLIVSGWGWASRRLSLSSLQSQVAIFLLWLALFTVQGAQTAQGYFDYWANATATYYHYDADYVAMARAAQSELAAGHDVVISSEHYKHNTIAWFAPETLAQARWIDGEQGLMVPAGAQDIVYLALREAAKADSRFSRALRDMGATHEVVATDPAGAPSVVAWRLPRGQAPTPERVRQAGQAGGVVGVSLGGELGLAGGNVPNDRRRDGRLRVEAVYIVEQPTREPRTFAARLVDEQGQVWGQSDRMAYLTEQWRTSDIGWQVFEMRLDPAMPAGPYTVEVALTDGERRPLPVRGLDGKPTGLWATLGQVNFEPRGGVVEAVGAETRFGPGLRVVKQDQVAATLPPGGDLRLGMTWQRTEGAPADQARLVWTGPGGTTVETPLPISVHYPPSTWREGEIVRPRYTFRVPAALEAGDYRLSLRAPTGETLDLGRVTVDRPPRRMEPGPIQNPHQARVGDVAALLGYDLAPAQPRPGEDLMVTLHWQAQAATTSGLTRFVHLVDANGAVRAQADGVPAEGKRPTTGWLPGEVVTDAARLALPADLTPGRYRLVTGLYDPKTLARLPVPDALDGAVVLGEVEVR